MGYGNFLWRPVVGLFMRGTVLRVDDAFATYACNVVYTHFLFHSFSFLRNKQALSEKETEQLTSKTHCEFELYIFASCSIFWDRTRVFGRSFLTTVFLPFLFPPFFFSRDQGGFGRTAWRIQAQ